jgi:hypothetical protein
VAQHIGFRETAQPAGKIKSVGHEGNCTLKW